MKPWLGWSLGFSLVSTAAALLWPESGAGFPMSRTLATSGRDVAVASTATAVNLDDMPDADPVPFERPVFDPFVGEQAPPPPAPPAPKPLVGPVYEAPPPPPPPPPMPYRYLGRMVDPSGQALVYLSKPDKDVSVGIGSQLDEGYVVRAIDASGVDLVFPSLGTQVLIPIPPSQN